MFAPPWCWMVVFWQWSRPGFSGGVGLLSFIIWFLLSVFYWSLFQASWLRCTMARGGGELRSVCRWKGGPGFFQGMCFPGIAPYRSETSGRHGFDWIVGGGSDFVSRPAWSCLLRAIPCVWGIVVFCLVSIRLDLVFCLLDILNGAVHLVPFAA